MGQAVALIKSDAALLLGGGILTSNVGSLALELDKPFFAVNGLGGSADQIAKREENKYRFMKMPKELLDLSPGEKKFGERVVQAVEFVINNSNTKKELRYAVIALLGVAVVIPLLSLVLFQHSLSGKEARLVLVTCSGAGAGVLLAYLAGLFIHDEKKTLAGFLGQSSLALLLGFVYGLLSLELGELYQANYEGLSHEQFNSLAISMMLLGIAVGAGLGQASRRAFAALRRKADAGG